MSYQWYNGSTLLTGQTNTVISWASLVATNAGTYTCVITNSFSSVTSSPAVLTVSALSAQKASYEAAVMAEPSLISYYKFDDRTCHDSKGTNHGTLQGTANFSEPFGFPPGSALDPNGAGWGQIGVVANFDYVSGNGTVEMWVRADWDTNTIGAYYPALLSNWDFYVQPAANYGFSMDPQKAYIASWDTQTRQTNTLPANAGTNWHHLAIVFNSDPSWTLFWDGVNAGTASLSTRIPHPGGTTQLGAPSPVGGIINFPAWTGKLDEVAFYSAALSATDIQNHAQIMLGPVNNPVINVATSGNNIVLSWADPGNWVLESSPTLPASSWTPVQTNNSPATIPISGGKEFFRLRAQ